jgi:hypothetical protein
MLNDSNLLPSMHQNSSRTCHIVSHFPKNEKKKKVAMKTVFKDSSLQSFEPALNGAAAVATSHGVRLSW